MFVNAGGDPHGREAGSVRTELVDAWDEFAREFAQGAVQADA